MSDEIRISLRHFDASIEAAYRTLFPGDPDKTPGLLQWRNCANPHGQTRFAVASRGDEIVGMIALVPTRLCDGRVDRSGYQAIDTSVHPSCRGRGLFVKMGSLAQDPDALGGELLWGFPNANAAPGWYGRLGWSNFGAVPLLIRPLRTSFLLRRLHPRLGIVDLPVVRNRPQRGKVYQDGAELSADIGLLWKSVAPDFGIAVDRSGEWMRWRLLDKPGSDYRCVGSPSHDGGLDAFVATKIADKHGSRLCYVMEAVSAKDRGPELVRLLRSELSVAATQGAEAALAWCPPAAPNYKAYRRAGFWPFPARLRPIEINFGARALVPEAEPAARSAGSWYVSFLDSDTN